MIDVLSSLKQRRLYFAYYFFLLSYSILNGTAICCQIKLTSDLVDVDFRLINISFWFNRVFSEWLSLDSVNSMNHDKVHQIGTI